MPVIKCFSQMIREFDLFPNPQFLRYNGGSDYKTTMGGLISMSVLAILVILFFNMAVRTATKQIITSKVSISHEEDPSETKLKMGPSGDMMFAVSFYGNNYSDISNAFSVTLEEENYTTGYIISNITRINMVQCTPDHFAFNNETSELYKTLRLKEAFCPPLNHELVVRGKMSSSIFQQFKVTIRRCSSSSNPSCLTNSQYYAKYRRRTFVLDVPIIQYKINPENSKYKEVYVYDQNNFFLSYLMGISSIVSLETTTVETDVSIMPYSQYKEQNITAVRKAFYKDFYLKTYYADITFKKSPKVTQYQRSFNKVDSYLSYIGGLMGTIVTLVFFMGKYTERAYEVSLSKKVLVDNESKRISSESFNLFYFITSYIKFFLNTLGCQPDWPQTQQFDDGADAITNQLDITYILRKLDFLDVAVARLLPQHDIKTIYMRSKPTFDKANHQRKMHFAPELIHQAQEDLNKSTNKNAVAPSDNEELGEVPTSPRNELTGLQKELDNVSAIDLSKKEIDVKNIKDSVMHVVQVCAKGRRQKQKLIDAIDPSAMKQLEKLHENEQNQNKNMIAVEKIEIEDYIPEESANSFHPRFAFNFQKDGNYDPDQ